MRRFITCSFFFLLFLSSVNGREPVQSDPRLVLLESEIVQLLPPHVRKTLQSIPSQSRRLLALSCYLRRIEEIPEGWSWTSQQVSAFKKTSEYKQMLADIDSVRTQFAARNPGYTLSVTIEARSLETQISKWNSVSSVGRAAQEFMDSCAIVLSDSLLFGESIDSNAINTFLQFLRSYEFEDGKVPTVAIPGLSKHGQLRAFDFKVMKGRRMIAGAHSATIQSAWESPGWTEKLHQAVRSVSDRFDGPLADPYEPWHYDYWPNGISLSRAKPLMVERGEEGQTEKSLNSPEELPAHTD